MKKQNRFYILLFTGLLLFCTAAFLLLRQFFTPGHIAEIYIDGELYETIDLQSVVTPYTQEISTEYGSNTISVEPGSIAVVAADCPDQLCMQQGALSTSGAPIVCLPHRLVIQIRGD
jgi:hypothetical protein